MEDDRITALFEKGVGLIEVFRLDPEEDDKEQDGIRPCAVLGDDVREVGIEVKEKANQKFDGVHESLSRLVWRADYNRISGDVVG